MIGDLAWIRKDVVQNIDTYLCTYYCVYLEFESITAKSSRAQKCRAQTRMVGDLVQIKTDVMHNIDTYICIHITTYNRFRIIYR